MRLMRRVGHRCRFLSVVKRAPVIAQPEPYQRPLALCLRPVLEPRALVPEPTVVKDLDLTGLEVELLVERRVVDDCGECIERGDAHLIELAPRRACIPALSDSARGVGLRRPSFDCKHRSAYGHLRMGRVLALSVETAWLAEASEELGVALPA